MTESKTDAADMGWVLARFPSLQRGRDNPTLVTVRCPFSWSEFLADPPKKGLKWIEFVEKAAITGYSKTFGSGSQISNESRFAASRFSSSGQAMKDSTASSSNNAKSSSSHELPEDLPPTQPLCAVCHGELCSLCSWYYGV